MIKNMMGQPCGMYGRVQKCGQRCCRFIINERGHLEGLRQREDNTKMDPKEI
jgi:hypothetical protein